MRVQFPQHGGYRKRTHLLPFSLNTFTVAIERSELSDFLDYIALEQAAAIKTLHIEAYYAILTFKGATRLRYGSLCIS
jgi:hypothetical protein